MNRRSRNSDFFPNPKSCRRCGFSPGARDDCSRAVQLARFAEEHAPLPLSGQVLDNKGLSFESARCISTGIVYCAVGTSWYATAHRCLQRRAATSDSRGAMLQSILIADDNAIIRRLIRTFLDSRPGFQACGEAVDGEEAVEKTAALKPDLIVLGLSMPRMNGLDAARVLRSILGAGNSIHKSCRCVEGLRTWWASAYFPRRRRSRNWRRKLRASLKPVEQP